MRVNSMTINEGNFKLCIILSWVKTMTINEGKFKVCTMLS